MKTATEQGVRREGGFSLIELLAVMAITGLLLTMLLPSLSSIRRAGDMTRTANDVAALLDLARAHAKANNTKVEVGFRVDNGGLSAIAVAAREGEEITALSKVYQFPQIRLAAIPGNPARPSADFECADLPENAIGGFTFRNQSYPVVIQFNSRGEARARTNELSRIIEIGMLSTVAGQTPAALAANWGIVQISGLSGGVAIYRP